MFAVTEASRHGVLEQTRGATVVAMAFDRMNVFCVFLFTRRSRGSNQNTFHRVVADVDGVCHAGGDEDIGADIDAGSVVSNLITPFSGSSQAAKMDVTLARVPSVHAPATDRR